MPGSPRCQIVMAEDAVVAYVGAAQRGFDGGPDSGVQGEVVLAPFRAEPDGLGDPLHSPASPPRRKAPDPPGASAENGVR